MKKLLAVLKSYKAALSVNNDYNLIWIKTYKTEMNIGLKDAINKFDNNRNTLSKLIKLKRILLSKTYYSAIGKIRLLEQDYIVPMENFKFNCYCVKKLLKNNNVLIIKDDTEIVVNMKNYKLFS